MTVAQIMAILSLLMAFGVDAPTVKNVESILYKAPSATISAMDTHDEVKEESVVEETPAEVVTPNEVPNKKSGYTYTDTPRRTH